MNEYKKTSYAINKYRKGIAYKNDDGSILEVTFEKIAKDNPKFTAEDFEKLKALSDEMYHDEAKNDWKYHHHMVSDLNEGLDERFITSPPLEDEILKQCEDNFFREQLNYVMKALLSPTQRRRFKMFFFGGLTYREIAQSEGADIKSVWESVKRAKKKIQKNLKKF